MPSDHRRGCNIPGGFLTSYQRNFAFLVFLTDDSQLVTDYDEQIAFSALDFTDDGSIADFGKIGGSPDWILDDESPATYDSSIPMTFLLAFKQGLKFQRVPGSRPQVELDLLGKPSPSPLEYYELFRGNAIYLYGTTTGEPLVYAVTQV